MSINKFITNIEKFAKQYCAANSDYNQNVERGQSAKTLVIGCADSLVDPLALMGAAPGELFVHRNIAGLVPEYNGKQHNIHATSAVLDYAVNVLQVNDIIVLGHGHCGGVKAVLRNMNISKEKGYAESWVEIITPALNDVVAKQQDISADKLRNICEKEAVRVSLNNLKTFPFIAAKIAEAKLKLHGWHFDRGTLTIYDDNNWDNMQNFAALS